VPGSILSWKEPIGEHGRELLEVESIEDEESQRAICKILEEKFPDFRQIEFL
jgi:hypothetical protein